MRLGMRLIRGVSAAKVASIERARCEGGAFETVAELARRSGAPPAVLARLAAADAFGSMRLSRREALWQVLALDGGGDGGPGSLLYGLERAEHRPRLPAESLKERLVQDYEWIGLSLAAHPMSLVRERLEGAGRSTRRC